MMKGQTGEGGKVEKVSGLEVVYSCFFCRVGWMGERVETRSFKGLLAKRTLLDEFSFRK